MNVRQKERRKGGMEEWRKEGKKKRRKNRNKETRDKGGGFSVLFCVDLELS